MPTFYPPLPPEERHPIRVLGLFDGIATGLVVLKELGLEIDHYVASEIDIDAVFVSRVKHKEIFHIGDIERITEKEVSGECLNGIAEKFQDFGELCTVSPKILMFKTFVTFLFML